MIKKTKKVVKAKKTERSRKKVVCNYAFIDSQNVNLAVRDAGWVLDWKRFRVYLKEKYLVEVAYIFIGYVPENQKLYDFLKKAGFVLVFKPTIVDKNGTIKGNCDAELVLQAMIDFQKYNQAVIATGDGDFYCLVKYLCKKRKLKKLLIPNSHAYSSFFKKIPWISIAFMNNLKSKLHKKR